MIAMTAEWALVAWTTGGFVQAPPVADGSSVQGTIWASETAGYPTATIAPLPAGDAPCVDVATFAPSPGASNANASGSVGISDSGSCATADLTERYILQMTVTPSLCVTGCLDVFGVYSGSSPTTLTLAGSVTVHTFSETGPEASTYTATFTLYADYGSPSPTGTWSIQLTVTER